MKIQIFLFTSWETTQKLYLAEFGEYIYEYDQDEVL